MDNRDAVHRILQLIKAAIKKNVTISNNMKNQKKKLEDILKGTQKKNPRNLPLIGLMRMNYGYPSTRAVCLLAG